MGGPAAATLAWEYGALALACDELRELREALVQAQQVGVDVHGGPREVAVHARPDLGLQRAHRSNQNTEILSMHFSTIWH